MELIDGVIYVGMNVTFFLCALHAEALYPFLKIGQIEVPNSLDTLNVFLGHLDTCKQIMCTYNRFCVRRPSGDKIVCRQKRLSLTHNQVTDVVHDVNDSVTPSVFFPND